MIARGTTVHVRAAAQSRRRTERAHVAARVNRHVDTAAYERHLAANYPAAVLAGEAWAVSQYIDDGARDTEWIADAILDTAPPDLLTAYAPETFVPDAIPTPKPAPRAESGGLGPCPRCGRTDWRHSGAGRAWHVERNPDCARYRKPDKHAYVGGAA